MAGAADWLGKTEKVFTYTDRIVLTEMEFFSFVSPLVSVVDLFGLLLGPFSLSVLFLVASYSHVPLPLLPLLAQQCSYAFVCLGLSKLPVA